MKSLIITYMLTYGGAIVSPFKPFWGLLVYVCFAIIKPECLWFYSVPLGNYSRIVAIGLLVGWALNGFGTWRLGKGKGPTVAFAAFVLLAVPLLAVSRDTGLAWKFIEDHLKILLPFLVGITCIESVRQLRQLAWVLVLSQGYVALEFNLSYYQGYNRLHEANFAGSDNNGVAIMMNACIGVAFFLGLHAERWWQKALAFLAALLMVHCVMFSFSRGGLLGLIVTTGVAFLLIPKQPKHYLALVVAVLIGLRLAGHEVLERFGTTFASSEERDGSAGIRLKHWKACIDSMFTTPWGVGPNQWRFTSPAYGLPSMEAHSYWLQVGAEMGFLGLLVIATFYALCLLRLWPLARERQETADPWLVYTARMVISSLAGFIISSQFVSVTGVEVPFYVALLGVGVLKLWTVPAHPPLVHPYTISTVRTAEQLEDITAIR